MAPKVSICIPAYNQPDFLRRTIQSVIMQDYKDYEVIITDDTPDDSVERVVAEFNKIILIGYHKNNERKGSPENWNEAISHASGKYIKIMHHDDWFTRNYSLHRFVILMEENPSTDFAFCSTYACDADQRVLYLHHPVDSQLSGLKKEPLVLFNGNFIGTPSTTIFRRNPDVRFDGNLKWVVDIDFYISMLKRNPHFIYSSDPLVFTTSGAMHQVTAECAGNQDVELFEWTYLYEKLGKKYGTNLMMLKSIRDLIRRYNVESVAGLRKLMVNVPIPLSIKLLITMQKIKMLTLSRP